MRWTAIPSFERLPLAAIYRRNFGRRGKIIVAMLAACEDAIRRGVDEATKTELMREAIRPLDRYAIQKGLPQ